MARQNFKEVIVSTIELYCETCEEKTPHFPILMPDEYIARWVCVQNCNHKKIKDRNRTVGEEACSVTKKDCEKQ